MLDLSIIIAIIIALRLNRSPSGGTEENVLYHTKNTAEERRERGLREQGETEKDEKLEEYKKLVKRRINSFVRIDSRLRASTKMNEFKVSFSRLRLIPLIMLISMTIGFVIFAVNFQQNSENEKMIYLSGFVIIVSIFIPIIQYIWNKDNEISNKKIEQHMLLQNQILIISSNLSEEDKEYAEEVLWRIEHLDISKDEEFLDKRLDKEIDKLGKELINKK